jgi:hypothetical protein
MYIIPQILWNHCHHSITLPHRDDLHVHKVAANMLGCRQSMESFSEAQDRENLFGCRHLHSISCVLKDVFEDKGEDTAD